MGYSRGEIIEFTEDTIKQILKADGDYINSSMGKSMKDSGKRAKCMELVAKKKLVKILHLDLVDGKMASISIK